LVGGNNKINPTLICHCHESKLSAVEQPRYFLLNYVEGTHQASTLTLFGNFFDFFIKEPSNDTNINWLLALRAFLGWSDALFKRLSINMRGKKIDLVLVVSFDRKIKWEMCQGR
jgi:hypothetical protein